MPIQTINPTTLSVLKEYSHHSNLDAFELIHKFSVEQIQWKKLSVEDRAQKVKKVASQLLSQKTELAKQASLEMGKPITQGIAEVEKCAFGLETMADLAVTHLKEKEVSAHYKKTVIRPEPYGLVFSIQPWNFPFWQALRMAACAWMSGNLVVLKHSSNVAGCSELIEQVCTVDEQKLILNLRLTHQDASDVINSSLIRAVTFTGSTSGGKHIAEIAGAALKKCVLELGGSDAYIVMPDCDLDLAVKTCVQSRLINTGQSCIAGKRFFIHAQIYSQFKTKFKEVLKTYKIGDPLMPETQVGPLADKRFLDVVMEQTKRARMAGAQLEWTENELPTQGYFSQLGILDFGTNLRVFENEEIFGPVASLYRFNDLEEVIQVINKGPFGLGAGIFTQDMKLADQVSRDIEAGTFVINSFVQSDPRVPFGGVKDSGLGREMGLEGLHDFVSWKVVGQA